MVAPKARERPICGWTSSEVLLVRVALGVATFPVSFNCTTNGNGVSLVTAWLMGLAERTSEGDSTWAVQVVLRLFPVLRKPVGKGPLLKHH